VLLLVWDRVLLTLTACSLTRFFGHYRTLIGSHPLQASSCCAASITRSDWNCVLVPTDFCTRYLINCATRVTINAHNKFCYLLTLALAMRLLPAFGSCHLLERSSVQYKTTVKMVILSELWSDSAMAAAWDGSLYGHRGRPWQWTVRQRRVSTTRCQTLVHSAQGWVCCWYWLLNHLSIGCNYWHCSHTI